MVWGTQDAGGAQRAVDPNRLPDLCDDSISDLAWSTVDHHLAVASWDAKVRIYTLNRDRPADSTALATIDLAKPALSCHWSQKHPATLLAAGTDHAAHLVDLQASTTPIQIAQHDAPIRAARFVEPSFSHAPLVATASWDQTLRYWDLRQPRAVATVSFASKVFAMDAARSAAAADLVVVATADRAIHLLDLKAPSRIQRSLPPLLKHQTRCLAVFPDARGFYLGSAEGRAGWEYLEARDRAQSATFKCHRGDVFGNVTPVFAVNAIAAHPTLPDIFVTAGGDGRVLAWNKKTRSKVADCTCHAQPGAAFLERGQLGAALTAAAFSADGMFLATAISYDWAKGYSYHRPDYVHGVAIHRADKAMLPQRCK